MASTPLDPRVRAAMLPWLESEAVGNPHSTTHRAGWRAAEAVAEARVQVAALIGAAGGEILFTSGATEANNLALLGASRAGMRVIVSATEHRSVLDCLPELERRGRTTVVLPVDGAGRVKLDHLERALESGPALVSIMAASNEIGTLQPLAEIGRLCRRRGALFHTDAVQALTTQEIPVAELKIDLLSLSGHKLYGPMGIGALYLRSGVEFSAQFHGGGQQEGRRPGTLPVPLCVGLGVAARLAKTRRDDDAARLVGLRDDLHAGLAAAFPGLARHGAEADSIPGCLNVSIPGVDAADLLLEIPEVALSSGSACSSEASGPSHVLLAIGCSAEAAHGSIRFGLGRGTTRSDIQEALARLMEAFSARTMPLRQATS